MINDKDRPVFGNLREMIDRTARIQICDHNTGCYEDYKYIEDVPHDYDDRLVFGVCYRDNPEIKGIDRCYNMGFKRCAKRCARR